MKRAIATLLSVVLMIGLLSGMVLPASAETYATGTTGSCIWIQEGTVLTIRGNGPMEEDYAKYGGYDQPWELSKITEIRIEEGVTLIGDDAFVYCEGITSITIPNSVTSIGNDAFIGCKNLESVTLGKGVKSIGDGAFAQCDLLKSITLPSGLETIGANAFGGCDNLQSITLGNKIQTIGEDAFWGCSYLDQVNIHDLAAWCAIDFQTEESCPLYWEGDLYLNGSLVKDLKIPAGVQKIPSFAFSSPKIESVTIPKSVQEIGADAFIYTAVYEDFVNSDEDFFYIGDCLLGAKTTFCGDYTPREGTRLIADEALRDVWGLTSITLPSSVAFVGRRALMYCNHLQAIEVAEENPWLSSAEGVLFDKNKTTLLIYPFGKTGEYTIPSGVRIIRDSAFYNCYSLTSVTIPNGVVSIERAAFYGAGITAVTLPDSIQTLGESAFMRCYELETVNLGNGVASIEEYTFANCSTLRDLFIGKNVSKIEAWAFQFCNALSNIYINDLKAWCEIQYNLSSSQPMDYADNLYLNGEELQGELVIPEGTQRVVDSAFRGTKISSVVIPDSVTSIGSVAFGGCRQLESVVLGTRIKNVDEGAFSGCTNLKKVDVRNLSAWFAIDFEDDYAGEYDSNPLYYGAELYSDGVLIEEMEIPQGVQTLRNGSIEKLKVRSIVIPNSVDEIEYGALDKCTALEEIKVAEGNPAYSSQEGALFDKNKTTMIRCPIGRTGTYVIPDGVRILGERAFNGCTELEEIVIPQSVTSIEAGAFYDTYYYQSGWEDGVLYIGDCLINARSIDGTYTIKEGTRVIADNAFYCNLSITAVTIPDSVAFIGNSAFDCCFNLSSIAATGVREIGNYAFYCCRALVEINFGEKLERIGDVAFSRCNALAEITLGEKVERIGKKAFAKAAYQEDVSNWEEGVLYIGDYLIEAKPTLLGRYAIKEGTRLIADEAFLNCQEITAVICPESMTAIGNSAFAGCTGLLSVYLPVETEQIGEFAFDDAKKLSAVYYGGSSADAETLEIQAENRPLVNAEWYFGETELPEHIYSGKYDATCNECGALRSVSEGKIPFRDIASGQYYTIPVLWAVENNITGGTGNGKFSPNMACDRGQVVTFLWRAAGCPEPKSSVNPFSDVKKTDYYYKAVLWAEENNITGGTGGGKFSPSLACDRGQIVTFLWRANGKPASTGSGSFSDIRKNDYYYDAVLWAVGAGITGGTGGGKFSPTMTCSRSQVVTFLYRAYV